MRQLELPSARLIFTVFDEDRGTQPGVRPHVTYYLWIQLFGGGCRGDAALRERSHNGNHSKLLI
jgi:hypothetical protein